MPRTQRLLYTSSLPEAGGKESLSRRRGSFLLGVIWVQSGGRLHNICFGT